MTVHIGGWIVPLLFTIGLLIFTSLRYSRLKAKGTLTMQSAIRSGLSTDDVAAAAIGMFLLWRFTSLALIAWLLWSLFSHPLQCGI